MNLAECYQILGLRSGASYRDIKAAYRRLAREYHPDTNPDKAWAEEQFIRLTTAYRILLEKVPPESGTAASAYGSSYSNAYTGPARSTSASARSSAPTAAGNGNGTSGRDGAFPWESDREPQVRVRVKTTAGKAADSARSAASSGESVQYHAALSDMDRQLKHQSYHQLRSLLQNRRFPRAIALVEGLAQRLPQDQEVRQWQAITYQRWGRQLIQEKQYDKARVYLKKALKADPHNKSLWLEVEKEFRKLETVY